MTVDTAKLLAVWVVSTAVAGAALAHGGGLNAEGCHHNRKTGDYHCHRAAAVQRAVPAPTKAAQVAPAASAPAGPSRPTCYVGPRGGTYTITASGKKNYKGC